MDAMDTPLKTIKRLHPQYKNAGNFIKIPRVNFTASFSFGTQNRFI